MIYFFVNEENLRKNMIIKRRKQLKKYLKEKLSGKFLSPSLKSFPHIPLRTQALFGKTQQQQQKIYLFFPGFSFFDLQTFSAKENPKENFPKFRKFSSLLLLCGVLINGFLLLRRVCVCVLVWKIGWKN